MEKKVFISYSDKDATYANLLARTLKKNGVDVSTLYNSLSEEMQTGESLQKELEESSAVIALISNNWTKSNWAAYEYGAAYALGKKIIPVIIDDLTGSIPINFNKYSSVDAKNEDLESVAHRVEAAL